MAAAAALALLWRNRCSEPVSRRQHPVACALLGAAAILCACRGWTAGVPGFAHDWKWPLTPVQSHEELSALSALWLPWGSGAPAIQALGTYPVTLAGWLLGYAFAPQFSLLVLIACIGAVAGASAGALAAVTGLRAPYQLALAFAASLLPAWFNRLGAGHLQWLLGCALAPALFAILIGKGRGRFREAGALGALWGIAGGQVQFLAFFPLAAVPFVARSRRLIAACAGFVLALALQTPALASMFYARSLGVFTSAHANLTWQLAQSDPLRLALISAADPAHYYAHAENALAFWASIVLIALAAWGTFENAATRLLGFVWILFSIWSSGLDGPLRGPMSWLFTHVADAIAFREFAHAQAIVAAAFAVLAAHGAARLLALRSWPLPGGFVLAILLVPLAVPSLSGSLAALDPPVVHSNDRDAAVRFVAGLPGSGQVLWWPGLAPIAYDGSRGGVDADAFVAGEHAPYAEYRPTQALAQSLAAIERGDRSACGLLAGLGVQAVVLRAGVSVPQGQALSALGVPSRDRLIAAGLHSLFRSKSYEVFSVPCYRGAFTIATFAHVEGDWGTLVSLARALGATDEITSAPAPPRGCRMVPFEPSSYRSVDVRRDWVPLSEDDADFFAFDRAFGDAFVTSNLARAPTAWVLAATAGAPYSWMPPARARRLIPETLAVWKAASCGPRVRPRPHLAAFAFPSRSLPHDVVHVATPALVVAHYSAAAGWKLLKNGEIAAQPVTADGFAAGWRIPPGDWRLELVHSGPPIAALWAVVALAAVLCAAFLGMDRYRA